MKNNINLITILIIAAVVLGGLGYIWHESKVDEEMYLRKELKMVDRELAVLKDTMGYQLSWESAIAEAKVLDLREDKIEKLLIYMINMII